MEGGKGLGREPWGTASDTGGRTSVAEKMHQGSRQGEKLREEGNTKAKNGQDMKRGADGAEGSSQVKEKEDGAACLGSSKEGIIRHSGERGFSAVPGAEARWAGRGGGECQTAMAESTAGELQDRQEEGGGPHMKVSQHGDIMRGDQCRRRFRGVRLRPNQF